jgi:hypothetical protein
VKCFIACVPLAWPVLFNDFSTKRCAAKKSLPFRALLGLIAIAATISNLAFAEDKPKAADAAAVLEAFRGVAAQIAEAVAGKVDEKLRGDDEVNEEDAQVKQWVVQIKPQMRHLLKGETHFLEKICQPTEEQKKGLKAVGEKVSADFIKQFAKTQKQLMRGINANNPPKYPEPHKMITEAFSAYAKEHFSADQLKKYQDECDKRRDQTRRMTISNLVAKLDKELILTADQREKIAADLSADWKDTWAQQLQIFISNDHLFPKLPTNRITNHLTVDQKNALKSIPQNDNQFWGWQGMGFLGGFDDDVGILVEAAVEPAEEVKEVEEKNGEKKDIEKKEAEQPKPEAKSKK